MVVNSESNVLNQYSESSIGEIIYFLCINLNSGLMGIIFLGARTFWPRMFWP